MAKAPAKVPAKTNGRSKTFAQMSSALFGRLRMLSRAGFQFGTKRDLYGVAGYPAQNTPIHFEYFWGLYHRNEIAGRIIDLPVKTTWRTPPEIIEEDSPKGTKFTDAFEELADRIHLWRYFEKADRLAGIGHYSVLFLGVRGVQDTALRTPLNKLTRPEDLIYLQAYHELSARISTWVTDTGSPRFGLPDTYQLLLSDGTVSGWAKKGAQVHASRLLHVAEDLVQDDVYGKPRLERAINRLFDLDKIAASVGEAYWQAAVRILQAEIDPNADVTPDQLDQLETKMAEMVHDLRRQFMGQGAKLSWLPTDVNPPKEIADFYFALISAACGIPRRILFGNEVGELASSTDEATYFGSINERQEHYAEPMLVRAFIDRLIEVGALPAPSNGKKKYEVIWPTLFELTELEQADANLKRAQSAAALTPMGGDPLQLVEIDDDRNVWLVPKEPGDPALAGGPQPGGTLPVVPTPTPGLNPSPAVVPADKRSGAEGGGGAIPPSGGGQ